MNKKRIGLVLVGCVAQLCVSTAVLAEDAAASAPRPRNMSPPAMPMMGMGGNPQMMQYRQQMMEQRQKRMKERQEWRQQRHAMMEQRHAAKQKHQQEMEKRLANIEALLKELVELQKSK